MTACAKETTVELKRFDQHFFLIKLTCLAAGHWRVDAGVLHSFTYNMQLFFVLNAQTGPKILSASKK